MSYLALLAGNKRLLAFGFLMAFLSSFGQTFFISLFNAEIRAAFGLTQGGFGTIYALATLTSAALLIPAGSIIDRMALAPYALLLVAGLAAAMTAMATMPPLSPLLLFPIILGLRFFGQGLCSQASVIAMARYFDRGRGKAIAIGSLGHSGGEALFPTLGVALVALIGWRWTWGGLAIAAAVLAPLLILWLLRGHGERHTRLMEELARQPRGPTGGWTRRRVLADPFFLLLLPATLATGFINTGVIFCQVPLVEAKGWELATFAASLAVYAAATLGSSLVVGPLVDRLGAQRVLPFVLLPLALGLPILGLWDDPLAAVAYMALAGLSSGGYGPAGSALWAEVYGVTNLGAIKGMIGGLMVFSTALSPALMGLALDAGVHIETLLHGLGLYALAAILLIPAALRRLSLARTAP